MCVVTATAIGFTGGQLQQAQDVTVSIPDTTTTSSISTSKNGFTWDMVDDSRGSGYKSHTHPRHSQHHHTSPEVTAQQLVYRSL
jgi:hypothetical protein